LLEVSVMIFFVQRVIIFNQQILPSWIVVKLITRDSFTLLLYCPCLCCHSLLW